MKLFRSTNNKITKDKNGENVPHLEITEVVLVNCNIADNDYQQNSRLFYTFIPNKLFVPHKPINKSIIRHFTQKFYVLKTFDSDFSYIEVWFTDQNSKPLETEQKINITLVVK